MIETTLQPEPARWIPATPGSDEHGLAQARHETRAALGLDPERIAIATGHQAAIWHAGILAKDLAVVEMVDTLNATGRRAQGVHFIADHDANDGGLVNYPTGSLERVGWRMLPPVAAACTRDRPSARPSPPPATGFAHPEIEAGLRRIHTAVDAHRDAPSLAVQLGLATADLARPLTGDLPRRSMSQLLDTGIGQRLLEWMNEDPDACIVAHDQALELDRHARTDEDGRIPRAVARPLRRGAIDELPLWRATPEGRRPVRRGEHVDPATCRPRALLATALARLGACDLFVHGIGGGVYDRAMELWIEAWLGRDVAATIAPATVATATVRLPLDAPTDADDLEDWTPEGLHRLRSNPDLGREDEPRREAMLEAINAEPRGSDRRRKAYLDLRREVSEARRRGRCEIERYAERLDARASARRRLDVARDRTWPFPLHRPSDLEALRTCVRDAFDTTAPRQPSPKTRGR